MPAGRIDVHFHMIPPFWAAALKDKVGTPMWGTPDWSFDQAMSTMDRLGTEIGMIALAAPSVIPWQGREQADMARRVNEFGLELRERAKGRLGYLATMPMPDVDATMTEIARAFDQDRADGICLMTNYRGTYLGDKSFAPVWDELDRRKATVHIHPDSPEMKPLPGVPQPTVDFPMDSTRTALSLVAGGVTERCPSVKMILSHAGGFIPYAGRRMAVLLHAYTMKDKSEAFVTEQLKNFYYDTALSTPDALPSLLAFAKPDRILFGSDNPYISPDQQAQFTGDLDDYDGFPPGTLEAINRGNAEAIFPSLAGKTASA